MKKITALLLVLVMVLGMFAACGGTDKPEETKAPEAGNDTPETTAAPAEAQEITLTVWAPRKIRLTRTPGCRLS